MDKQRFIAEIYSRLNGLYGAPETKPTLSPISELIKTILSQNTTDKNRDRAYKALQESFDDWEQLLDAPDEQVIDLIQVGGLGKTKTAYIKKSLRAICEVSGAIDLEFLRDMDDESALKYLTSLPGVGAKTAHCVLAFSLGRDIFPVDTHVLRLSKRWQLIPQNTDMTTAHKLWAVMVPPGLSYNLHTNIIRHGREVCFARNPKCDGCKIADICPDSAGRR